MNPAYAHAGYACAPRISVAIEQRQWEIELTTNTTAKTTLYSLVVFAVVHDSLFNLKPATYRSGGL